MPALFALPKQVPLNSGGELLPGAKLYFFATGTSTPQNTYQDIDLSTPHANPVESDADGVLPPIYLDGSLPSYRVRLTTSDDVQIYQIDDYPSNQNTSKQFSLVDAAPQLIFEETDATANNGKWRIRVNSELFTISLLNDAESVATDILTLNRSGDIDLPQGSITSEDEPFFNGVIARKSTSTARSLTTALSDDPHLTLSLRQASNYIIDGVILFRAGAGGGHGIKIAIAYPDVGFAPIGELSIGTVNGSSVASTAAVSTTIPLAFSTISVSPTVDAIRFSAFVSTTAAGSLSVQWAQNSSSADTTQMDVGSWIRAQKVS